MTESQTIQLTVTKEDRVYTFTMPIGHKYGEAFDACLECLKGLSDMSKKAADIIESNRAIEKKKEEEESN